MARVSAASRLGAAAIALLAAVAPRTAGAAEEPSITRGDLIAGPAELGPDAGRPALRRYAIVVGNGDYQNAVDLPNARRDAELVAGFLRAEGFHVVARQDLDRRGFENVLRQALFEIEADSEVVFYYAGHGFQIGRRNYIVPVDADLSQPHDLAFDTVTLDALVAILGARSRMQIIVLDSCRDNPFANRSAIAGLSSDPQPTETGFSPMAAPVNTLISFSTAPGAVALDGDGRNSPFTAALVEVAANSRDVGVTSVLESVRRQVYVATKGRQIPWESSTLVEAFSFARAPGRTATTASASPEDGTSTTRSLKLLTAAAIVPGHQTPAPDLPAVDAMLEAPLERRVAIGEGLLGLLKPAEGSAVTISGDLAHGRLVTVAPDGTVRDHDGALAAESLRLLAYEPAPMQVPALPRREDHLIREVFTVTGPDGRTKKVALMLRPTECDWQAGDHLDPEGIGITRYASDIAPEEALAACRSAVAGQPENGRFHYQLARAQIALKEYEAAEASLERARDLGHTRAWYGLGQLSGARAALTGGKADLAADEAAYPFYFEGVRRGDPYAYYSLGKQLLRYSTNSELQSIGFD
ncbi:MAG TPA: caspase family protein, partial [Paracoccaceae bacterium]|nr:caspase family protein [Paracoccaceae bacterium]